MPLTKIHQAAVLVHHFCFSIMGDRGTNKLKIRTATIFNADRKHFDMAEHPAALHELCCHACLLFTVAIPQAMSVASRIGALVHDQPFLRQGLPGTTYTYGDTLSKAPMCGKTTPSVVQGGFGTPYNLSALLAVGSVNRLTTHEDPPSYCVDPVFQFSLVAGLGTNTLKNPNGNNFQHRVQALCQAECPAALHERCCRVCLLFAEPYPRLCQ